MQVPGNWETTGLPDFDGVVWFTRTFDVPSAAAPTALVARPRQNNAEVWVNGQSWCRQPPRGAAPHAGGAAADRRHRARQALRAGANTITVRIQNTAATAGSSARRILMYLDTRPARGSRSPEHGSLASSGRPTRRRSTPSRANSPRTSRWPRRRQHRPRPGRHRRRWPRRMSRLRWASSPGR